MVITLAKDQFIDALHDDETKLKIRQHRPQTLQRSLELALELESYNLAGRHRSRHVREVRLERGPRQRVRNAGDVDSGTLQKLKECLDALQSNLKSGGAVARETDKHKGERRAKATCWGCKQKGHYRWECTQQPKLEGDGSNPEAPTSSAPQQTSGNGQ